jgi:hypothetical protein
MAHALFAALHTFRQNIRNMHCAASIMAHALALFILSFSSCFHYIVHLFILERTLVDFVDRYNYTVEPRVSSALCDAMRRVQTITHASLLLPNTANHARFTLLSEPTTTRSGKTNAWMGLYLLGTPPLASIMTRFPKISHLPWCPETSTIPSAPGGGNMTLLRPIIAATLLYDRR